jgi:hypothetical protein
MVSHCDIIQCLMVHQIMYVCMYLLFIYVLRSHQSLIIIMLFMYAGLYSYLSLYSKVTFNPLLGNTRNTHTANNIAAVFSL